MIAQQVMGVFADLLDRLNEVAPSDTINPDPGDYDAAIEDVADFAFLTDPALPDDPDHAAIVGVIDDVMPFAHTQMRVGDADSRIASIWLQDVPPDLTQPVGADLPFGRELRGAQISALMAQLGGTGLADEEALYRHTGAIDFRRAVPQRLALAMTHGSAVAGHAAGVSADDQALGRSLPVIAVCLPTSVSRDTLGTAAPFYITLAIMHIVHRARRLCRSIEARKGLPAGSVKLPVVINISFGLTAGPKDGSSLLEQFMDAISASQKSDLGPVRFVLPMGNHRQNRLHAEIDPGAPDPLGWEVKPNDQTPSFLEIWGPPRHGNHPPAPMQIECTPPGADQPLTTTFAAHGTYQILRLNGREVARAYLQHHVHRGHGREVVTLVIPPTQPEKLGLPYGQPGLWNLRVISNHAGPFNVYVQRDESLKGFGTRRGRQSHLIDETDPIYAPDGRIVEKDPAGKTRGVLRRGTLNAFATGRHPLAVGGCYASDNRLVPYSGLGFGGGHDSRGDVVAPSELSRNLSGVASLGTFSGSRGLVSGTSLAAPQAARALAIAFVEGTAQGKTRDEVATMLGNMLSHEDHALRHRRHRRRHGGV